MHKKLFGLLATAVVGLTLTSCGGGGGGGNGGGEGSAVNGSEIGAPMSLVGRTLELVVDIVDTDAKNSYTITFDSESTFSGTATLSDRTDAVITNGKYNWKRDGAGQGRLTVFTFEMNYKNGRPAGQRDYSGTTLLFDTETGKFVEAKNPAGGRYTYSEFH